MTKRELIEALEDLECSDDTEVRDEANFTIFTVKEVKTEDTGIISRIEVS